MSPDKKVKMPLPVFFFLALFVLCSNVANALTISQTLYTPTLRDAGSSPPVNSTLSFQQFNTTLENGNLGILNSVLISLEGNVLADFSITNTGATTVNVNSNISGDLRLRLAELDIITLTSPSWVFTSKNGLTAGSTWTANNKLSSTASDETTLTSSSDLALFTGTGLVDLFAYTDLMVTTGISGGTDYQNNSQAWAREGVTITYDYTDSGNPPTVPEPATLLLLGSGIGAVAFLKRRKTKMSEHI